MKMLIFIFLLMFTQVVNSAGQCLPVCQDWDTFCKSEKQIIATKCRLGIPVKREACQALDVPRGFWLRSHGGLVDPLPCTAAENEV